jgi:hypothetical protein
MNFYQSVSENFGQAYPLMKSWIGHYCDTLAFVDDISFCGRMSSFPDNATVHKERQICCTTKKDRAAVNEAVSVCNGEQPTDHA